MAERRKDRPDGQPPTCVGTLKVGSNGKHTIVGPPAATNGNHPAPVEKCDLCDQPGAGWFDNQYVCQPCARQLLDALIAEQERPVPKAPKKTIFPGQRGRVK